MSEVSQSLVFKRKQIFGLALILAVLGVAGHVGIAMWAASSESDHAFAWVLLAGPLSSALIGASLVCALFAWKVLRPSTP